MSLEKSDFKTQSEKWTYGLLRLLGYSEEEVSFPDRTNTVTKDIDFLIPNLAIEVKEITPSDVDISEDARLESIYKNHDVAITQLPNRNNGFRKHIKDANEKFKNYSDIPTLLIFDLEWGNREPSLNFILYGIQTLLLPDGISRWIRRPFNPKTSKNISAFIIKAGNKICMYHINNRIGLDANFLNKVRTYLTSDILFEFSFAYGTNMNIIESYVAKDKK